MPPRVVQRGDPELKISGIFWHPERRGRAGIQNGGVIRMSGMSSMLCIGLYRDVPSHHEPK